MIKKKISRHLILFWAFVGCLLSIRFLYSASLSKEKIIDDLGSQDPSIVEGAFEQVRDTSFSGDRDVVGLILGIFWENPGPHIRRIAFYFLDSLGEFEMGLAQTILKTQSTSEKDPGLSNLIKMKLKLLEISKKMTNSTLPIHDRVVYITHFRELAVVYGFNVQGLKTLAFNEKESYQIRRAALDQMVLLAPLYPQIAIHLEFLKNQQSSFQRTAVEAWKWYQSQILKLKTTKAAYRREIGASEEFLNSIVDGSANCVVSFVN